VGRRIARGLPLHDVEHVAQTDEAHLVGQAQALAVLQGQQNATVFENLRRKGTSEIQHLGALTFGRTALHPFDAARDLLIFVDRIAFELGPAGGAVHHHEAGAQALGPFRVARLDDGTDRRRNGHAALSVDRLFVVVVELLDHRPSRSLAPSAGPWNEKRRSGCCHYPNRRPRSHLWAV